MDHLGEESSLVLTDN